MSRRLTVMLPLLALACAVVPTPQEARAPFVITGQVVDSAGRPFCGARVCAVPEVAGAEQHFPCVAANGNGEFRLGVGGADRYRVIAERAAGGHMSQLLPFYRHPTLPPPVVTVGEAGAAQHVRVEIVPPSGVVALRLADALTGRPVEDAQLSLCLIEDAAACLRRSARSDDGMFNLRAAHLPFTMEITADGYEPWRAPAGGGEALPLSVASRTTLEFDVKLTRRGGGPPEPEQPLGVRLPAPAQLAPAAKAVFVHHPRHTRLEWSQVAGAASYAVEIDYCSPNLDGRSECLEPQSIFQLMRQAAPASGIVETSYEFNFVGAQPGRWRVWAVDAEGGAGLKSGWRRFVYLN